MPEYEVNHPDESDSDMSTRSFDNDFGVPIVRTFGVKKAIKSANEKLRRSCREKNLVTWFVKKTVPKRNRCIARKNRPFTCARL